MMQPMELPQPIALAVAPVFDVLPLDQAMDHLVPKSGAGGAALEAVRVAVDAPALAGCDAVKAGLWLYIDELDLSHTISQGLETPTGSLWHGIMHRREGDFFNAKYWYRMAGQHPALASVAEDYDPYAFVDRVARVSDRGDDQEAIQLVQIQRAEWSALFVYCAVKGL